MEKHGVRGFTHKQRAPLHESWGIAGNIEIQQLKNNGTEYIR